MAWYNTSWAYRVKVTVDDTKVTADLTDFPVYLNLANMPAGFFTHVRSDGGDIRVTTSDGTTEVPREVVGISTGGSTGEVHFKAPSLANATDTDFYVYYGNASATEPAANASYGKYNVWTNSYIAVYHMNQDPSGSAPQILDSTSAQVSGTTANMESGDLTAVKIYNGISFDGSNESISFGDNLDYTANFTAQCWARCNAINQRLLHKSGNWSLLTRGDSFMYFEPVNSSAANLYEVNNGVDIVDATTRMYHAVINGTTSAQIYVNGSLAGTDSTVNGSASAGNANTFYMGQNGSGGDYFNGLLDEVRISSTNRSSTWISTEYNNQNDPGTFYSVGPEENAPASTGGFFRAALM